MARRKKRRRFRGLESQVAIAKSLRSDAKDFRLLLAKGDCRHAFMAVTSAAAAAGALSQDVWSTKGKHARIRTGGAGKIVNSMEDKFMRRCLLPRKG